MRRLFIRWTPCVMAATLGFAGCAELATVPAAGAPAGTPLAFHTAPPAGKVPFIQYSPDVNIMDENGQTIWQDVTQPLQGASFQFHRTLGGRSDFFACGWPDDYLLFFICPPVGAYRFLPGPSRGTPSSDFSMPRGLPNVAMLYFLDTCVEALRDIAHIFPAGEQWRIIAAPDAPGGRKFVKTEILIAGLNGNPDHVLLPCAEGAGSLTCTVTLPQDVTALNRSQFHVHYALPYPFGGFLPPVQDAPATNVAKAGRAIPIKFSLDGNRGLGILAARSPSSVPVTCDASAPAGLVEETATAGTSGLHYDAAADTYVYVWKTEKSWAGTCREFRLALADGLPAKTARFHFK